MWLKDKVLDKGSAVVQCTWLYYEELEYAKKLNTKWYRSKDRLGGGHPFASYMMNKKWTLEEEFNNHMLRFHQVTLSFIFQ